MLFAALSLTLLLTGCPDPTAKLFDASTELDPNNECDHPYKPYGQAPYSEDARAQYVNDQGKTIDVCRALLGH